MKPEKAQSIADGFLAQRKISLQTISAVKNSADFQDLMNAYIADRGGCPALVDALVAVTHAWALVNVSARLRPNGPMPRSHWLDPLARKVLQATGQLPTKPPAAPVAPPVAPAPA